MAGPGGGPPRRSHTKSRKGCDTCKRRHIRCDENFPQCRNCIKHNCRCPYMDMMGSFPTNFERSLSPERADLMWTPKIEAEIARWQQTGIFPLLDIFSCPTTFHQHYYFEDLRLLYHIASVSKELGQYDANKFTIWTHQVPLLLKIGINQKFVIHALLAFAATHLAWLTKCSLTASMAYEHRGIAMNGLHEAIGSFSKQNSDAVLAASLLLLWQESSWRGWTQLMSGISSVIDAMYPWKNESQFEDFITEQSIFPLVPKSPLSDIEDEQPQKKDLNATQQIYLQLQKLEENFGPNELILREAIQKLKEFIQDIPETPRHSAAELFEILDPLRAWLFWQPVLLLQQTRASSLALLTLAHYYTVSLVIEKLLPEDGAAYFGYLTLKPIEKISRQLISSNMYESPGNSMNTLLDLIKYPVDMASSFRSRLDWAQPKRASSPLIIERDYPNTSKSHLGVSLHLPLNDSRLNNIEQKQYFLDEPQSMTLLALEPLSSPFFMISSPHLYGDLHSPGSSNFDEFNINIDDPRNDYAFYDSDEYNISTNTSDFIFPTTTVWI